MIGVLAEKGQSSTGTDQDDIVFVPSTTALYRMSDGKTVHDIMGSATSESAMDQAKAEITTILRKNHL